MNGTERPAAIGRPRPSASRGCCRSSAAGLLALILPASWLLEAWWGREVQPDLYVRNETGSAYRLVESLPASQSALPLSRVDAAGTTVVGYAASLHGAPCNRDVVLVLRDEAGAADLARSSDQICMHDTWRVVAAAGGGVLLLSPRQSDPPR